MYFPKATICPTGERATFDDDYLTRLRRGDHDTARHFNGYFRRLVYGKIAGLFDRDHGEDLLDRVMVAALEKILRGQPRDAKRLVAYVYGICSNLIKKEMRPRLKLDQYTVVQERIRDSAQTAEESVMAKERALVVRTVLNKLSGRDRAVLEDLFYFELDRDEVCRKQNVTREQLRLVLFHARQRFQKEWASRER